MKQKLAITLLAALMIVPPACIASEQSASKKLLKAIKLLGDGEYSESIKILDSDDKGLSYIKDYVLYYRASALVKGGEHEKAAETIRRLLKKYPGSPIRQKARLLEIETFQSLEQDKAYALMEGYIREFPDDHETKLLYARRLEEMDKTEDAQKIYLDIYISADQASEKAYELLFIKEFDVSEKLMRAANLVSLHKYADAEPLLEELAIAPSGVDEKRVTRLLARSLFRQKKYKKAIPYLKKLGNRYDTARAYIRSGDRESFHRTVLTMVAHKDKKASKLLIALAEEASRDGEIGMALEYLDDAMEIFPSAKENALWSKGWLYLRTGRTEKAGNIFKRLYRKYRSDRYAYWTARAREMTGEDPVPYYKKVKGNGYYALLAALRNGGLTRKKGLNNHTGKRRNRKLRRADILLDAGLLEDAALELKAASRKSRRSRDLQDIGMRLVMAGDYLAAIRLMDRVPGSKRPEEVMYPLAYWPEVSKEADRSRLDPLLLLSLMREESRFDYEAFSPAGAVGLMQLMPSTAERTARAAGIVLEDSEELFSAETNIVIGAQYFRSLVNEFGSVTPSLAAYNAGEIAVRKWLLRGDYSSYDEFVEDIPYKETREYVKRIMRSYFHYISNNGTDLAQPEELKIL
jgi:soluble lytic murein transglycosylase